MIAYTESCPVRQGVFNGGIAQLARACGSYPQCRGFKSPSRYAEKMQEFFLASFSFQTRSSKKTDR